MPTTFYGAIFVVYSRAFLSKNAKKRYGESTHFLNFSVTVCLSVSKDKRETVTSAGDGRVACTVSVGT